MRELIQYRSEFLAQIRQFFSERQVLEVDTNLITNFGVTDVALVNMPCAQSSYLITSPEYAMKKLLSMGSGDIYQLSHVFRDEELGRKHRREFMLLEWYRVGWTHARLMNEVVELVRALWVKGRLLPIKQSPYRSLFKRVFGQDILAFELPTLQEFVATKIPESASWGLDKDGYLDLLFTHFIETNLGQECMEFVTDYPPSQAALANIVSTTGENDITEKVAARFELYINGLELCNGFWELTDADLQRQRFAQDNHERQRLGLPVMPIDEPFLQALAQGMPMASGVALGVDRLMMITTGAKHIDEVTLP